jgi:hypothetical protein
MKLTKNQKIYLGVVGLGILAYATRKYWMPKKKTTATTPTGNVSTQSAPISSSNPVTINAPKRDGLIAELKKQSLEADPDAEQVADDFYKNFSDRELEVLLIFGKMNKDGVAKNQPKSETEAKQMLAKYGTTPEELGQVMTKMFENAFSSLGKKPSTPKK